jgi:hypothetical protein
MVVDFLDDAVEYFLDRAVKMEAVASKIEDPNQRLASRPMAVALRYLSAAERTEELIKQGRLEKAEKFLQSNNVFVQN